MLRPTLLLTNRSDGLTLGISPLECSNEYSFGESPFFSQVLTRPFGTCSHLPRYFVPRAQSSGLDCSRGAYSFFI
jgi:hypothetical protein